MSKLYVLGARQRDLLLRKEEEWNLYESALILEVDTISGAVRTCFEYQTPPQARAAENSSSIFKSATLIGDVLYACTNTEVLVLRLPDFSITNYISLPCFNDVHHVKPAADGSLLVVSTGLDMVVRVTPAGELLNQWAVLGGDPWLRFSRDVDYRTVSSTKPHASHPNFVFEISSDVWVTRFKQKDAIALTASEKRIVLSDESPHDGLLYDDKLYFTVVDGRVVIVNPHTLSIDTTIDLKSLDNSNSLLGWCRGILPQAGGLAWIGFTRVRKTRIIENILWVKHVFKDGMIDLPTHIALYDITTQQRLRDIDLEQHGMNIIFSIFSAER
jgi:hypothetical protein